MLIKLRELGFIMGVFIKTFFQTLGYGMLGMIAVCFLGAVFNDVFPSSESVTVSDQHIENSAEVQDMQASMAESIYQKRAMIDSGQAPEPVSGTEVEYEGADGHVITFVHNSSAVDPSYSQMIHFVKFDTTDQTPYDIKKNVCGDYAEHVQHNAEKLGWHCGWVFVELDSGNHACNVFNTTDRGLVFVDCTGFDSVVTIEIGKEYKPIPLTKLLGYNNGVSADSMGIVESYKIMW